MDHSKSVEGIACTMSRYFPDRVQQYKTFTIRTTTLMLDTGVSISTFYVSHEGRYQSCKNCTFYVGNTIG